MLAFAFVFIFVMACVGALRLTPQICRASTRLAVTSPMGKRGAPEKTASEYWDEFRVKVSQKTSGFNVEAPTVGSAVSTFRTYTSGDNIFFIHSVTSVLGGFLLLFLPDLFTWGNKLLSYSYQQYSVAFLAIGYLAFRAPEMDVPTKKMLINTFLFVCSMQTVLCLVEVWKSFGKNYYNLGFFANDIVASFIFGGLALGYWESVREKKE